MVEPASVFSSTNHYSPTTRHPPNVVSPLLSGCFSGLPRNATMGLTIKLPPEATLHRADDRGVTIPGVAIVPTAENMPHVSRFEVELVGSSTQPQQGEVYRAAEKLRLGYPKLEYRSGKEVALRQQMSVPLNRVILEDPIPPGARFALTVQVWYYDSDAQGRPNVSAGLRGPVRGSSTLTPAVLPVTPGPAPTAGPCRMELDPPHLALIDRGEPGLVTVRVANRPADVHPRLALADSFPDAPALAAGLKALLASELKRAPEQAPGGWEVWRAELALQLEPEARRLLWERSQGGPLEVAARAELPGKLSQELSLGLLCQEDVFKGLIAIDFGTSNSTVTL